MIHAERTQWALEQPDVQAALDECERACGGEPGAYWRALRRFNDVLERAKARWDWMRVAERAEGKVHHA